MARKPEPIWAQDSPSEMLQTAQEENARLTEDVRRSQLYTRGVADLPVDQEVARREMTEEQRYLRMPSKAGRRWKGVADYDDKVQRIQMRQEELRQEASILHARLPSANQDDANKLATWHENGGVGPRPESSRVALEQDIERISRDLAALDLLIDGILDEKETHVRRHRKRLERDAEADVERAHERIMQIARELEEARGVLVDAHRTLRWAQHFPKEDATRDALLLNQTAGGYMRPVKQTLGTSAQVPYLSLLDAVRADADVLRDSLKRPSKDGLDVRREAYWLDTEEGQQALTEEKKRTLADLQTPDGTGWGD